MKTITPKELAVEVNSDPKTVRKFLRHITPKDDRPGKGSRWVIPANAKALTKLKGQFDAWDEARQEAAARRAEEANAETETDEVEDEVEVDEDADTE